MIVRELITRLGYDVDDKGASKYDAQLDNLKVKAAAVVAALVAVAAVVAKVGAAVSQAGDRMTASLALIEGAIGRSATSAAEAAGVYERLYALSLQTGVGVDASASAFSRFNAVLADLGRGSQDTIDLISGIQAAALAAGTSAQELEGAMTQLGQAMSVGKLQGQDLKALRTAMPDLVRAIARELNLTMAQFTEQAERGLLTMDRIIPAMLRASRVARSEMSRAPLTMARAWAILGNATTRFLADIDKAIQLSRFLAHVFLRLTEGIEWLRRKFTPVGRLIRDVINQLGGVEAIARMMRWPLLLLAGALGVVAAALLVLIAPSLAVGAAIFAVWAVIDDFITWVRGEDIDTLFGSLFGDFDTVVAQPLIAAWNAIRDGVVNAINTIASEWERFWASDQVGVLIAALTAGAAAIMAAWSPVRTFFVDLWNDVTTAFENAIGRLRPVIDWLRDAARWLNDPWGSRAPPGTVPATPGREGPAGAPAAPRRGALRPRGSLLDGAPLGGEPGPNDGAIDLAPVLRNLLRNGGLPGAAPFSNLQDRLPGPRWGNVHQEAVVNINQTVNATSSDPAAVAAGASSGVRRASGASVDAWEGAFARSLAGVAPRVEPAAQ